MAKITAPNPEYTGESASVKFENGVGETSDANLIGWFLQRGYTVEEIEPVVQTEPILIPLERMNKAQLCAAAESKGIKVVPDEMTKAQIIAALRG